jgi:hypothetical protein
MRLPSLPPQMRRQRRNGWRRLCFQLCQGAPAGFFEAIKNIGISKRLRFCQSHNRNSSLARMYLSHGGVSFTCRLFSVIVSGESSSIQLGDFDG